MARLRRSSVPKEKASGGSPPPPADGTKELSEYEIQRLSRIQENRKRMSALGIPQIVTALAEAGPKLTGTTVRNSNDKGKMALNEEDEDYDPNMDKDDVLGDDFDDDDDYSAPESPRKKKGKRRMSTPKKKTPKEKAPIKSDSIDNDDDDLMQAIALSLQQSNSVLSPEKVKVDCGKKRVKRTTEGLGKSQTGKSKPSFSSRVKMTEDEVILHFFQFDEAGKGSISIKDLERVAISHDFTWTDKELFDMIHCFDADGDGKLGLDDFRGIAQRCNILQGPD